MTEANESDRIIAVLGAVGQQQFHVGYEAMTVAAVLRLKAAGFVVRILTRSIEDTAARYPEVQTEESFEFPASPLEREALYAQVADWIAGEPVPDDVSAQCERIAASVAQCQGLLIAGGGNLNSLSGRSLYERAAIVAIAQARDVPVLITSQTVGPTLTEPDRETVAQLVSGAKLFGVRETHSYQLCAQQVGHFTEFDPSVVQAHVDDAVTLVELEPVFEPIEKLISVTIADAPGSLGSGEFLAGWVKLLNGLLQHQGLSIELVPHQGTIGASDADQAIHEAIARELDSDRVTVLPLVDVASAISAIERSHAVISNRYHPVVFALGAGKPAWGFAADSYTYSRIDGVFDQFGISGLTVPIALLPVVTDTDIAGWLNEHTALSEHLDEVVAGVRIDLDRWWESMIQVLRATEPARVPQHFLTRRFEGQPLSSVSTDAVRALFEIDRARQQTSAELDRLQEWSVQLESRTVAAEQALGQVSQTRGWRTARGLRNRAGRARGN